MRFLGRVELVGIVLVIQRLTNSLFYFINKNNNNTYSQKVFYQQLYIDSYIINV